MVVNIIDFKIIELQITNYKSQDSTKFKDLKNNSRDTLKILPILKSGVFIFYFAD